MAGAAALGRRVRLPFAVHRRLPQHLIRYSNAHTHCSLCSGRAVGLRHVTAGKCRFILLQVIARAALDAPFDFASAFIMLLARRFRLK